MALDSTKWQVQVNKAIRYIGPDHGVADANYVTVLELHRWLQDLADGASVIDNDYLDITTVNPSDKKYDTIITLTNGYTLDDAYTTKASQFIYGGSIIQGTVGVDQIIYDGVNVVANRGVVVNVIQNGAVLTPKFWNSTPNGESFAGLNADPTTGTAMRFMVKVHDFVGSSGDIDNRALLFTTREWGKTFSEFRIPSTGRGVNVVPLTYATDLNNTTAVGTVATWTEITNVTSGFNLIDVDNNTVNEEYYSEWSRTDGGVTYDYTINEFYERMKWLTRNGATTDDLYGLDGELFRGITHSIETVAAASPGAFVEGGATPLSWTGGTGQVLAYDATDKLTYIQLLTGVVPGNGVVLTQGANTATTITSPVTEKTVSAPFCGASTGSSIVGSYGFALEYADLAVNDKLQALDGTTRQPPNNVTFTVGGVASGYRVLVGPEDGSGGLKYDQLSHTAAINTTVTTITVAEAIPANTPAVATGVGGIRIERTDGSYTLHAYTAVNTGTSTFTIPSHDFSTNPAPALGKVFISYIDAAASGATISYSTIQTVSQTLFIEARFGGTGPNYTDSIKPARTTGTLGSTGGSATVSTVSDA